MWYRKHFRAGHVMHACRLGLCVLLLGWFSSSAYGDFLPVLQDAFSDNFLSPNKWATVTPFANSAVREQRQRLRLINGGWLLTRQEFDPIPDPFRVRGRVRFNTNADSLSIVTRSNGVPTNAGIPSEGIEFLITAKPNALPGPPTLHIRGLGAAEALTAPVSRTVPLPLGEILEFEVHDLGRALVLMVQDRSGRFRASLSTITFAGSAPPNFVAFLSREDNAATVLDNVVIELRDLDGDGKRDARDACPNSDVRPTVIFDGCDSDVTNYLDRQGCTVSDFIIRCAQDPDPETKTRFLMCVARVTRALVRNDILIPQERQAIRRCAARTNRFEEQ